MFFVVVVDVGGGGGGGVDWSVGVSLPYERALIKVVRCGLTAAAGTQQS